MTKYLLITKRNKIIFLIPDGLDHISEPEHAYQAACEVAKKPNIDNLPIKTGEQDGMPFHKRIPIRSNTGTIYRKQPIPLVRPHAFKLDKYCA